MNILIGQGGRHASAARDFCGGPKWTLTPKILLENFQRNNISITSMAWLAIAAGQRPDG
jgi:hypothetical protein